MLKLSVAPPGVDESTWSTGKSDLPLVGDLWLLSWNGEALGLAVVSGVAESFVLAWPATLPEEPAFPPAVSLPTSVLDRPLNVWPSRETGVGNHLLHRNFGPAMSERTMAAVAAAFEDGTTVPLEFAIPNIGDAEREAASDLMVDRWDAICFNVWPNAHAGHSPFNSEALRSLEVQVSELRSALSLSVPDAVSMYSGETVPTAEQVLRLAAHAGVEASSLLTSHADELTRELQSPRIKNDVLNVAARCHVDEGSARDLVRSEFALAARSDGTVHSRLEAAVHRLLTRGS